MMHPRFRSFIATTAVAVTAVTGGVVVAAPATAAPPPKPIPRFSIVGETFGMVGDHDFCRGTVRVDFTSPQRGITRVTLTSNGFTGDGAGWTRNPICRSQVIMTQIGGRAFYRETSIPVAFGRKAGNSVSRDVVTGSGLISVSVGAYTRARAPQSSVVSSYLVVP